MKKCIPSGPTVSPAVAEEVLRKEIQKIIQSQVFTRVLSLFILTVCYNYFVSKTLNKILFVIKGKALFIHLTFKKDPQSYKTIALH